MNPARQISRFLLVFIHVYTLTFYNPRHNEAIARENVRQIVHLAVPTGAASIATLDKILKILTTVNVTVEAGVGG